MNAQTKKRTLLGSMLVIVLCLSLIAGSTFALFTDEHKFNIAVTSGDIEILANAEIVAVYSAAKPTDSNDPAQKSDEFLTDEFDTKYYHQEQTNYEKDADGVITKGTFSNGGDVQFDNDGVLTLNRVTPGDRVDIKINVDNKSNVAFIYRYKLIASDTNLAKGMAITLDLHEEGIEKTYESLMSWTSEWKAPITAGNDVPDKFISIELPVYAGNEYQSESVDHPEDDEPRTATGEQKVEYTIIVEAVQANAHLTNNNEPEFNFPPTITPPNYAEKEPTNDESGLLPGGQTVYYNDLRLTGTSTITVDRTAPYIFRNISAATDGALIIADPNIQMPLIFIESCDFTLANGQTILQLDQSIPQLFISNDTTINGVRVSEMSQAEIKVWFGYPDSYSISVFAPTVETD